MTHNLARIRTYLRSLSPTTQIAASLLIVAVSTPPFISSINAVRQTLDALCGPQTLSECHSRREAQKANEAATGEFFRRAAEARQAETQIHKDMLSRTWLAEAGWGKPYGGPFTVPFADHSIVKIPLCPPGERPRFNIEYAKPAFGRGIVFGEFSGYWMFDLFQVTAGGWVYTRSPVAGTLTVLCQPMAAGSRGKQP